MQSNDVIDKLYESFGIPKDNWQRHDYLMICHGCGRLHKVHCDFISSPLAIGFRFADDSQLSIPANGCPECMAIKLPREQHPIFLAWSQGMTREAYNRAASFIGADLQPETESLSSLRFAGNRTGIKRKRSASIVCSIV